MGVASSLHPSPLIGPVLRPWSVHVGRDRRAIGDWVEELLLGDLNRGGHGDMRVRG